MQRRETDLDLRVGHDRDDLDELHRVVDATELVGSGGLARHRHGLVTGLSVVVTSPEAVATAIVDAVTGSVPPEIRVELVLGDPSPSLTGRLERMAWPWTAVSTGPDRATSLDVTSAACSGEFLVFASEPSDGVPPRLDRLAEALGLMWVNGADALVLEQSGGARPSRSDGRSELLASMLGLRRPDGVGLVVLRRWVARFLFEELGRAIDACHELAERVRLLELRLIEVRTAP